MDSLTGNKMRQNQCSNWIATVMLLAGATIGGCDHPKASSNATGPTGTPAGAVSVQAESQSVAQSGLPTRDGRTKWIGDIPYDVFFDRPLEVYQEGATAQPDKPAVGTATAVPMPAAPDTVATTVAPTKEPDPEPPASPAGTAQEVDWGAIVPIDLLQAETKEIRTRLSAGLQTVATFNANTKEIETDGSVLALIADIVERHPQELNWKDRARFVRQLAYDIYLNANGKGRGPFQSSKEPFEKIVGIWDGGPAPETDVPALTPLGEAGDRGKVMLYFESSFNRLRSDVNTPMRLKEERDAVMRTTKVLAALGTALEDASFDGADQEQYRALLQQFIAGQQQMADAAKNDEFSKFEQARDSVQKSCDACHLEYRTKSAE